MKNTRSLLCKELGKEIKRARIRCNYSQQDVADRLRIARSTYGTYELGTRQLPMDVFIRICDVLNAEPYEMLERVRKFAYKG